jgi:hypothetical protein
VAPARASSEPSGSWTLVWPGSPIGRRVMGEMLPRTWWVVTARPAGGP